MHRPIGRYQRSYEIEKLKKMKKIDVICCMSTSGSEQRVVCAKVAKFMVYHYG